MSMRTHIYPHKRYYWYAGSSVADWLDDFSAWLKASGYCKAVIRGHVAALRHSLEPLAPLPRDRCFSQAELEQIIAHPKRPQGFAATRCAFGHFLRSCDQWIDPPSTGPHVELMDAYHEYLLEIRGLAPATVKQHEGHVKSFLNTVLPPGGRLANVTAGDVERFIAVRSRQIHRRSLSTLAAQLRLFLRFCTDRGDLPAGLDMFDSPRRYRGERPPRAIPWALVERLLESIDRSKPIGLRYHAIFYLMAQYGLRTGEIPLLRLDSIDWQARTIRVEQSKTRSTLLLPLTGPAAKVLRRYLREGRPATDRPELFPRFIAPSGPLTRGAIATAFRRCVKRSGLPLNDASPYGLRHGFAMRLLERNVGVKAIGDLLGHTTLEATSTYLRLQIDALRDVALPLPGECHAHR